MLGLFDGIEVGMAVGTLDGEHVRIVVGFAVGEADGNLEGVTVGVFVGLGEDGANVGAAVGDV